MSSPTQFDKDRAHENQPMKRSKDIFEIFKYFFKAIAENIKTLSQEQKWRRLFLQVRTWKSTWAVVESYLGSKTLMKTWTVIGESGLLQLLINAYKRELKHQSKEPICKHSKPMQEHFTISLIFLRVHHPFFPNF